MTNDERLLKNAQISQTKKETINRHRNMICRTYTCKIHKQSLSKKNKDLIERMFVEAKWLKNYILAWSGLSSKDEEYKKSHNIFKFDAQNLKTITHKDKDMNDIEVNLTLHSMIKAQIKSDICSNIKTIHTLRQRGFQKNNGILKFVKEVNYIPLKKYGYTHKILSSKRVTLPGLGRKGIIVNGLNQFINIPEIEICNARLLKRADGLFIQFITYQPKINNNITNKKTLGIDFGCSPSFTTSEGEKIDVKIQESERLKKTMTRMNRRMKKGSKNWHRQLEVIHKEYQKQINKKNDIANKLVAKWKNYDTVVIQDEQLQNWYKNGHGKAIQQSVLGRVKFRLKNMDNVVVLSKNVPTTKMCTNCGKWHDDLKIWNRQFVCECGINMDRDIHAAQNMIWFYKNKVGVGCSNFKRAEIKALCDKALGIIT